MNTILQLIVTIASATTLFYSINCINCMGLKTHHGVRSAYTLISAGAFGEIIAIATGHVPGVAEVLFMTGIGALDFFDRRAVHKSIFESIEKCPLNR